MNFTTRISSLVSFFALAGTLHAQITLSTKLDYNVYLQFEPLLVRTTVKSGIGQATVYNSEPDGPNFYLRVNDEYGHQLPPLPEAPRPEPVMVPPQVTVSFTNNLIRYYNLSKPGFYSIQPCVDWMGKTYSGEKKHIEIVTGREVLRVSGRVPANASSRTYMIRHVNRMQQDHLLLRIDDENANLCFGVYPLGRSVMNEKPQLLIDSVGNAHILYKTSPYQSSHLSYSPFGQMIEKKDFGNEYNTLILRAQPDGSVQSTGSREGPAAPKPIESILGR